MSASDMTFVWLVVAAFGIFAAALGYQSFAEWRWRKNRKR
jgi:hypothetical protein